MSKHTHYLIFVVVKSRPSKMANANCHTHSLDAQDRKKRKKPLLDIQCRKTYVTLTRSSRSSRLCTHLFPEWIHTSFFHSDAFSP
ncbi:hypothetical protein TSAR_001109 [Trichomalopsis sarcophagae]|uniref:Uncharacterized protein n=1 Tax=Trichomalopsis sarcophagae TaxID=543379 RepID=A0A232FH27_9HYME|nr:hypothetical protein TSAR_001109 [Trichomalopsis sarcophagae]